MRDDSPVIYILFSFAPFVTLAVLERFPSFSSFFSC